MHAREKNAEICARRDPLFSAAYGYCKLTARKTIPTLKKKSHQTTCQYYIILKLYAGTANSVDRDWEPTHLLRLSHLLFEAELSHNIMAEENRPWDFDHPSAVSNMLFSSRYGFKRFPFFNWYFIKIIYCYFLFAMLYLLSDYSNWLHLLASATRSHLVRQLRQSHKQSQVYWHQFQLVRSHEWRQLLFQLIVNVQNEHWRPSGLNVLGILILHGEPPKITVAILAVYQAQSRRMMMKMMKMWKMKKKMRTFSDRCLVTGTATSCLMFGLHTALLMTRPYDESGSEQASDSNTVTWSKRAWQICTVNNVHCTHNNRKLLK